MSILISSPLQIEGGAFVEKRGATAVAIPVVNVGLTGTVDEPDWIEKGAGVYLSLTAAAATLLTTIQIYSKTTRLPAELVYEAINVDAWTAAYVDRVPWWFEDTTGGGSNVLFVSITNNGAVNSAYTLEICGLGA